MPLEVRSEKGRYPTVVVCDQCRGIIADGNEGMYCFQVSESHLLEDSTIHFLHKSKCFDQYIGPRGGRVRWRIVPLECLPVYLGDNLKLDWDRARNSAGFMEGKS